MFARWRRRSSKAVAPLEAEAPAASSAAAIEGELRSAIHAAYIDMVKGHLDRTQRAADFVTASAAGVGTIYTGLLALVYSVGSDPARPLPARGIAPAVFLALAFLFGVVNVGFLRASSKKVHILPEAHTWDEQQLRLVEFMRWVNRAGQLRRAWALRVSVVCLGAAVALLPLPFVSLSQTAAIRTIAAAAAVVAGYVAYEAIGAGVAARRRKPS